MPRNAGALVSPGFCYVSSIWAYLCVRERLSESFVCVCLPGTLPGMYKRARSEFFCVVVYCCPYKPTHFFLQPDPIYQQGNCEVLITSPASICTRSQRLYVVKTIKFHSFTLLRALFQFVIFSTVLARNFVFFIPKT